ncbi:DUF771 domain-containing protein [Bacillus licheniformis]|uniref:DUF771 domain-containing protein n=1 Tax=Bacillus licheniformis TaxID=1402 RepID=UPI0011A07BE4|nr:DUF771 domain-containing protein [Bacillus licheniformis]MBA1160316.1 DUF771 domain-containing protein [Bacillus licheniformis]
MEQCIKVQAIIPIPENQILIEKVELKRLQSLELVGKYWSMQDLEERTNKKRDWIKENILYKPKFRMILDVNYGGFVYYPERKGQNWSFQANKMAKFLDENFAEIFSSI